MTEGSAIAGLRNSDACEDYGVMAVRFWRIEITQCRPFERSRVKTAKAGRIKNESALFALNRRGCVRAARIQSPTSIREKHRASSPLRTDDLKRLTGAAWRRSCSGFRLRARRVQPASGGARDRGAERTSRCIREAAEVDGGLHRGSKPTLPRSGTIRDTHRHSSFALRHFLSGSVSK